MFALTGVVDNSGMRFYYSSIAREQNAGIMELGHSVTLNMLIPPGVSNYTVLGLCPTGCTEVRTAYACVSSDLSFLILCRIFPMVALEYLPIFFTLTF